MTLELLGAELVPSDLGLEVSVAESSPGRWRWSVANAGDVDLAVTSVRLRFRRDAVAAPVRVFRNGYQSWSPTGSVTLGEHVDPSRTVTGDPVMDDVVGFARRVHHADAAVAP